MKRNMKRLGALALSAGLILGGTTATQATTIPDAQWAGLWEKGVKINTTGGATEGDGLYIVYDRGSFLVYRNNQIQNYIDASFEEGEIPEGVNRASYNGVLLHWNGFAYKSPEYNYAHSSRFPRTLVAEDLGAGALNTLSGNQASGFTAISKLFTDLNSSGTFDAASEIRITVTLNYEHPNEYFKVDYAVEAPTNANDINLYHGIDMYLDGADSGPVMTADAPIGPFTGRYLLQQNPETGAVGGFINAGDAYSSYYADYFWLLTSPEPDENPWTAPNRGPVYGEPLPNTATEIEDRDVGVGIHFALGAVSATTVNRSTYVIFASGLPGRSGTDPIDGLDILSKGEMAVGCGDTTREITGEVENVTDVKVGGISVPFTIDSDSRMSIDLTNAPIGVQDLRIVADEGEVNWQRAYDIGTCAAVKAWTSFNEQTNKVRIYAKNIVDKGKIQFIVDGKEVGWVRPVDASNPKLITNSNGVYFVRTVTLDAKEKNRVEIKLNGERLVLNTYVPKD